MNTIPSETAVGIIGAGPAGLMLANLLQQAGVPCVILERASRSYVEQRARAGLLEHRSVALLARHGLADRLLATAERHGTCELRVEGRRHRIPYSDLCGGKTHYVYPQQEVVKDLIAAFLRGGGHLVFEAADVAIADLDSPRPGLVWSDPAGQEHRIRCDFVAGCDGAHGVSRRSLLAGAATEISHHHGIGWLGILAAAPPSTECIIYAVHEEGFAGHMLRSPTVSRYYLQIPLTDRVEDWPDERIWAALHRRLAVRDGDWRLTEGPILDKSVLEMRSRVIEPMQSGRLFLAGDAAHTITPIGAKGMNLALHDSEVLAAALTARYRDGSDAGLAAYSGTCLHRVWRAQEFSHWFTSVLHTSGDGSAPDFHGRLAQARRTQLLTSPSCAAWFAESYIGWD